MNAETPLPHTPNVDSTPTGRRVPKKTLGLLAAAALSAGAIGSVALMNTAAAETPEPQVIVDGAPEKLTVTSLDDRVEPVTTEFEKPMDDDDWDCPACGMG